MNKYQKIKEKYAYAHRDSLIPILQDIQEEYGYLPREAMIEVSGLLGVPVSKVYGVATFYNQFRFTPVGKYHIQICRGTACHVKGSLSLLDVLRQELNIEPGQTTRDGLFTLDTVACIGACGLAPVMAVNGEFYARLTDKKVSQIIKSLRSNNE
ncbi:MAG: NADH-quinone oxidoreductase subunit NuoE [Candidatus Margulisiibacteriota bacterium]